MTSAERTAVQTPRSSDDWLSSASYWAPRELMSSAWLEHGAFASWLIEAHRPRTLVELGTHNGFSYFVFCEAVRRLGLDTRTWAIDTWAGDDQAGFYSEEVFQEVSRINERYAGQSTLLRGYFADQVTTFEPGSIDLLHIDGRHGYEDVREDFETYLPTVSSRGIVVFHDVAEHQPGFGVHHFWDEIATTYPSFHFTHGHGLGVLLVGDDQTDRVRTFMQAAHRDPDAVRADYAELGKPIGRSWERVEAEAELERKLAVLADVRASHEIVEGVRDELSHQLGTLAEHNAVLRSRLEKSNSQRRALRAELTELRQSRSWKITAPLRKIRGRG